MGEFENFRCLRNTVCRCNSAGKITDHRRNNYLLRICRYEYHTTEALNEELQWLKKLSRQFQVPTPVASNNKKLLTWTTTKSLPEGRNAALFQWTDGVFLTAKKRRIPIFHMEAGNRCFDQRVPEEVNRKIVDHLSDINMPLTEHARRYLIAEGLPADQIIKTGSCMKEVLNYYSNKISQFQ